MYTSKELQSDEECRVAIGFLILAPVENMWGCRGVYPSSFFGSFMARLPSNTVYRICDNLRA
jgi:hypothetical protein